jgi:hypothetical protein
MNTSSKTVTRYGYHRLAFPPEPPVAIVAIVERQCGCNSFTHQEAQCRQSAGQISHGGGVERNGRDRMGRSTLQGHSFPTAQA